MIYYEIFKKKESLATPATHEVGVMDINPACLYEDRV